MKEYQTGAVRDTGGKGRMDLLPWCALIRVSKHMEDAVMPDPVTGKSHYTERNWENGLPMHTMIDSAFRHLAKYTMGMDDEDHLCAAATNLLMAMWMEENRPDMQDIPPRGPFFAPLLRSEKKEDPKPVRSVETQEEPKETYSKCINFHDMSGSPRCAATRNMDSCNCDGDITNCDHMYD